MNMKLTKNLISRFKKIAPQKGFALLYTVLVVTLILTIAISISNVSYRQGLLSSLARDSQTAFYQADSGMECALYFDLMQNGFPAGNPSTPLPSVTCAGQMLSLRVNTYDPVDGNYFQYDADSSVMGTNPCFSFTVSKDLSVPSKVVIQSRGLNTCQAGPRQVERGVEVNYQ
jgi:hypothetical protein